MLDTIGCDTASGCCVAPLGEAVKRILGSLALAGLIGAIAHALNIAVGMTWEILWALILGFALSGAVQAVVRSQR